MLLSTSDAEARRLRRGRDDGGMCRVDFTTAFDQYAIKAFQVHAVDYLLKPFGAERLAEALVRARSRILSREALPVKALVSGARDARSPLERILIRDKADVHVIPVAKIDYFEAQDDYVSLKVGEKNLLKEQTLAELEQLLDPNRFVPHPSALPVERRAPREDRAFSDRQPRRDSADGTELPISRSGYAKLARYSDAAVHASGCSFPVRVQFVLTSTFSVRCSNVSPTTGRC